MYHNMTNLSHNEFPPWAPRRIESRMISVSRAALARLERMAGATQCGQEVAAGLARILKGGK